MQSYQRFQCIGHMGFNGLSNAVTDTHPLLPSMGTTRQKSSCRNGLQNGPRLLSRAKAGTHSALQEKSHTRAYTAKQGAIRMGVVSLPSAHSARSRTSPGRVSERRTLPLLGLGRGCSQRTQKAFGTAMRLCASLFRGVAAPLGCVIFFISDEIVACMTCSRNFFRFSRRSSLCCSCASCVSARSFSVLVFARKTTGDYFSRTPISARSWSRGLGFAIVLDLLF